MYFYTLLIILFNYSKLGDPPFFFRFFLFVLSSEKIKLVTFRTINILFFFCRHDRSAKRRPQRGREITRFRGNVFGGVT